MDEARYRSAEQRLWEDSGAVPEERRVHLARLGVEVRLLEAGSGDPVIFLHGGPSAGAGWAPLAARVKGYRCIVPDRPGTGLSAPLRLDASTFPAFAADFAVDVMDALGLDRAHLVGSSTGGYMAFATAMRHPDRVNRSVQLGCPDLVEGMRFPASARFMLFPGMRHLIAALPASEKALVSSLREMGHGPSLEKGRISRAVLDWAISLQRDTPTLKNELASMTNIYRFFRPLRPELTLGASELAKIRSPTLFLWGEHEPYGDVAFGRNLAAAMPDGTLEVVPDGGHLPWHDDPIHVAEQVRAHLAA